MRWDASRTPATSVRYRIRCDTASSPIRTLRLAMARMPEPSRHTVTIRLRVSRSSSQSGGGAGGFVRLHACHVGVLEPRRAPRHRHGTRPEGAGATQGLAES